MTASTASKPDDKQLPGYARMLHAHHRARAAQLRALIATLPIAASSRVLDVASGDGCYSIWMAERAGRIVGVDRCSAYLGLARRRVAAARLASRVSFEAADVMALPFADDSFDLAWCAQSLFSLPDPLAVLREMTRVTRPGGHIAILESDTLHQLLLPWPAELELAVRQAQLAALAAERPAGAADKFYVGRSLCSLFRQCGVETCAVRTFPADIHAPLGPDESLFLRHYLADLRQRAWPHLEPAARAAFDILFDPRAPTYLPNQPDFHLTHIDVLALGQKRKA